MTGRQSLLLVLVLLGLPALLPLGLAGEKGKAKLDQDQAKNAFEYLNKVRANPANFSKEIGTDLSNVKAMPALKWNAILAKVAEDKALDMATRDYFDHVTPEGRGLNIVMHEAGYKLSKFLIQDKKATSFESIAAGPDTGIEAIRGLVLDKGTPNLGHRTHLLGLDKVRSMHRDAGIGFARNPKSRWRTYVSVIIAHPY